MIKKSGEITIIGAAVLAVLLLAGILTPLISKKKDTPIEQGVEHIIETQYGIDIDFSPEEGADK